MELRREEVRKYLKDAIDSFPHQECSTCECFVGYLTQLQIDSGEGSKDLLAEYKPEREEVHSCLGCNPCSPGDHFARYLQEKRNLADSM